MEKRVETVTFKGVRFRRYPDAVQACDRRYFTPGIGARQRGVRRLHEEVWMDAHGVTSIPAGFHVHHRDHDHDNNDPSNLELVDADEHRAHHGRELTDERRQYMRDHAERIRPKASEWHRSEAGRAWHSEHGKRVADQREPAEFTCEQCGTAYETVNRGDGTRFCSNKCKVKWRRDAGLDNETRTCAWCDAEFTVNRYSKTRFCSRSCGSKSHRSPITS